MSQEPEVVLPPQPVDSIEQLVAQVSLKEVRTYEFRAHATAAPAADIGDPKFELSYGPQDQDTVLADRFRFEVTTNDAEYSLDIAALFETPVPLEIPEEIRLDFAERIGFMTLFPFVRESMSTSAGRLGRPGPLLDLVRPGDLNISPVSQASPSESSAGDGQPDDPSTSSF